MLCRICTVPIQPTNLVLDQADYMAPTWQTWARPYRSGIYPSALNDLDHQVGVDHTDHTDHLSEVWIALHEQITQIICPVRECFTYIAVLTEFYRHYLSPSRHLHNPINRPGWQESRFAIMVTTRRTLSCPAFDRTFSCLFLRICLLYTSPSPRD